MLLLRVAMVVIDASASGLIVHNDITTQAASTSVLARNTDFVCYEYFL